MSLILLLWIGSYRYIMIIDTKVHKEEEENETILFVICDILSLSMEKLKYFIEIEIGYFYEERK